MQEIYQSASGIGVLIGPFLDVTDGKTPEPGIDLTTADYAVIIKHGCSASLALTSATWTDMTSGWFALQATSTMFDTIGQATIRVHDVSVCLPVWKDIMIVPTAHWEFKYGTTKLTVASVSNTVNAFATSIIGATIASISNSVWFTAGTIASVSNAIGIVNTVASISTSALIASVSGSALSGIQAIDGKTSYLSSATVGDWALTASVSGSVYGMASSIWGKVTYQPSSTVGDYTIASVTGSVFQLASSNWGKTSYLPSVTIGSWSISGVASVSVIGSVASVSVVGMVASVSGSLWGMASSMYGRIDYLPSVTIGSWSISGVASISIGGTIASVSGSIWGMASSIMGKTNYIPSATVEQWTIASVSNSVWMTQMTGNITGNLTGNIIGTVASVSGSMWGMVSSNYGRISYLPSITIGSWSISAVASVSIVGLVGSVSASVVDAIFEEVVEGTTTFRTSQKYQNAFAAGEATGGGTATVTIRDIADTLDRIKMDVNVDGNRSAVTRNDG